MWRYISSFLKTCKKWMLQHDSGFRCKIQIFIETVFTFTACDAFWYFLLPFFFLYTVHDPLNLLLYKSCDLPLENSLCKRKKQRGGEGAGAEALEARRCGPGLRALAWGISSHSLAHRGRQWLDVCPWKLTLMMDRLEKGKVESREHTS